MSLKLSPQLDADAVASFALYEAYLQANRSLFPKSCINVIEDERWYGGCFSPSPHDALLSGFSISRLDGKTSIQLQLTKQQADISISISYINVVKSSIESLPAYDEDWEWRYEQFLHYNPYGDFGITEVNVFEHDIEWTNGIIWKIFAEEVVVEWTSFA